jgi:hypothetical protein
MASPARDAAGIQAGFKEGRRFVAAHHGMHVRPGAQEPSRSNQAISLSPTAVSVVSDMVQRNSPGLEKNVIYLLSPSIIRMLDANCPQ